MDLIAIGFWESTDDPGFVHPRKLVGSYDDAGEKAMLVAYLESGKRFSGQLGFSYCRFCCGEPVAKMGNLELSDGRWVWPQGLAHYVDKHDVVLPQRFMDYARSNNWQIPDSVELPKHEMLPDGETRRPVDYTFWMKLYPKGIFARIAGKIRQRFAEHG